MKKQNYFFILFFIITGFHNSFAQDYEAIELQMEREDLVEEYHDNREYAAGVKYILDNYASFENDYRVNYLLGEMGLEGEFWEASRKGYERTIALVKPVKNRGFHEAMYYNDNIYFWNSIDGLGVVYYKMKDYEKSLEYLEKANEWLQYVEVPSIDKGKHYYNLACACGLNDKCDAAVSALKKAVSVNSKYKSYAKTDGDFDSIRSEEAFQLFLYGNL